MRYLTILITVAMAAYLFGYSDGNQPLYTEIKGQAYCWFGDYRNLEDVQYYPGLTYMIDVDNFAVRVFAKCEVDGVK